MTLNDNGLTQEEFLESYDSNLYEKPSVTTDILLFTVDSIASSNYKKNDSKILKVLLIKRRDHPFINHWALPGGFVDMNENLEIAALRELKEETDLDQAYIEQLYTFGEVDRDPRMRVITVAYMALVDHSKLKPIAGDDAKDVDWFEIERVYSDPVISEIDNRIEKKQELKLQLNNKRVHEDIYIILEITETLIGKNIQRKVEIIKQNNIASDHGKIIDLGLDRLMNKLEYTQIAFNLLAEHFTLTEVQNVYETILGKKEKPAGFRRKIKDMVIESHDVRTSKGHRPAKLYTYNKYWHLK